MKRLAVTCWLVALSASLAAAPAADAKRKKPRACRSGQVTVVVKGRTVKVVKKAPRRGRVRCAKRTRSIGSKAQLQARAQRLLRGPVLRPRYVRALERRRAVRRLNRFMPSLARIARGELKADARRREIQTSSSDISSQVFRDDRPPGGKATAESRTEVPDDGEMGGYTETDTEISTESGGSKAARRKGVGLGGFATRCPDAAGRVSGVVKFRTSEGISVVGGGKRQSGDAVTSFEAKIEGIVGDDGRLQEFSYAGTATMRASGYGTDGRYQSRVYRVAFSNGPIARSAPIEGSVLARSKVRGWGPRGDNLDAKEIEALLGLWSAAEGLTLVIGRDQLLQAEKAWYDRGECVEVDISPSGLKAKRGGSFRLRAVARSKRDRSAINGGTMRVSTRGNPAFYTDYTCPGQVAPGAGVSPHSFTLSDPGRQWGGPTGVSTCAAAESVSRRGRGEGYATYPGEKEAQYFKVKAEGFAWFNWSKTYGSHQSVGTAAECHKSGSGSGLHKGTYGTDTGGEQYVVLAGDTLSSNNKMDLTGLFEQDGNYSETWSGPGCPGGFVGDRSGCGSKTGHGSATLSSTGPGRASLSIASYDDKWDREFSPCPITAPTVFDGSGNPIHENAAPGLEDVASIRLPIDQLSDPNRATIVVQGTGRDQATEYCSKDGANNGGVCGPEESISIGGTKNWGWKLTFTRITPP